MGEMTNPLQATLESPERHPTNAAFKAVAL